MTADTVPNENKLYLENIDGRIAYSVITPTGETVQHVLTEISAPIPFELAELQAKKQDILKASFAVGHTLKARYASAQLGVSINIMTQIEYDSAGIFEGYPIPQFFIDHVNPLILVFMDRMQNQTHDLRPNYDEIMVFFTALRQLTLLQQRLEGLVALHSGDDIQFLRDQIEINLSKLKLLAQNCWYLPVQNIIATCTMKDDITDEPLSFSKFDLALNLNICQWFIREPDLRQLPAPVALPINEPPPAVAPRITSPEYMALLTSKDNPRTLLEEIETTIFVMHDPNNRENPNNRLFFGFYHNQPLPTTTSKFQAYLVTQSGRWIERPDLVFSRYEVTKGPKPSQRGLFQSKIPMMRTPTHYYLLERTDSPARANTHVLKRR